MLPLWTGIIFRNGINILDKKHQLSSDARLRSHTCLSNNYVENRFGFIKTSIMMGGKPCLPSEIVPKLYNQIKVRL